MENKFYSNSFTVIDAKKKSVNLNYNSNTFFIGSCFANNLYKKLTGLYLNTNIAPFGNIYNPISLSSLLNKLILNTKICSDDCFKSDGLYQHFDFHTTCGQKKLEDFKFKCNSAIEESHLNLITSDLLVITLGTAYVYEKDNKIVNNCHKLNKEHFNRRLLSIAEITTSLLNTIKKLQQLNNKIQIVFTLSPVRHLRDNPEENSLSKAILRVAIDTMVKELNCIYFPAYEILLDELRDYRWYADDLVHPNNKAIEYILDNFLDSVQSNKLKDYIKRTKKINTMLNHKIINSDSDSTNIFLKKKETTIKQFKLDYKDLYRVQNISI